MSDGELMRLHTDRLRFAQVQEGPLARLGESAVACASGAGRALARLPGVL